MPLPVRISLEFCKCDAYGGRRGDGVAVCVDLGLLVISFANKLQVFALPDDIARATPRELAHVCTLGGVAPMEFQFGFCSGHMAFTDGGVSTANRRLLLVTDCRQDDLAAVHVIDVVRGAHVGYVAAPGTIIHPSDVATRESLVAVSCWEGSDFHEFFKYKVRVFQGSEECTWTAVRTIAVTAAGLRYTADGLGLEVAQYCSSCMSIFYAKDGYFVRHSVLLTGQHPQHVDCVIDMDVEKWVDNGDGGSAWWVMCPSGGLVAVADDAYKTAVTAARKRKFDFHCTALATVPTLGLLVVRHEAGVQFFATPDAVAMASMSFCKVAWMAGVCRATIM